MYVGLLTCRFEKCYVHVPILIVVSLFSQCLTAECIRFLQTFLKKPFFIVRQQPFDSEGGGPGILPLRLTFFFLYNLKQTIFFLQN
jgi:hypothetical protein